MPDIQSIQNQATELATKAQELAAATQNINIADVEAVATGNSFLSGLTVFVLACFVGYYVVWRVTPALHSPLMAVTNAVSSVIIVGALLSVGMSDTFNFSSFMGFLAIVLASVNIFGGFIVTRRMLAMFKKN